MRAGSISIHHAETLHLGVQKSNGSVWINVMDEHCGDNNCPVSIFVEPEREELYRRAVAAFNAVMFEPAEAIAAE